MNFIYCNGDYAFVNRKDSGKLPGNTFEFAPDGLSHAEFNADSVLSLVKGKGGYIIYDQDGVTKQFSSGNIYSVCDYYFGADFSGVVYRRDNSQSRIYVGNGVSKIKYGFTYLMPDKYMSHDFNRLVGKASLPGRWCVVGDHFFQQIDVGDLYAINSDYYALKSGQFYAAFGVHGTMVPWIPVPQTQKAAETAAMFYNGQVGYKVNGVDESAPFVYVTHDLGVDGICLTSDVKANASQLKLKLAKGLSIGSIDWAKKACFPGFSNDDENYAATFRFGVSDRRSLGEKSVVCAIIYTGDNAIAKIETAITRFLTDNEVFENASAYVDDSQLNRAFAECEIARQAFILKEWQKIADGAEAFGRTISVVATAYGLTVIDQLNNQLRDSIKQRVTAELGLSVDADFKLECSDFKIACHCDEPPQKPEAIDADTVKAYIRTMLLKYGAGLKDTTFPVTEGDQPVAILNDDAKGVISTALKASYTNGVINPILEKLNSLKNALANVSIDTSDWIYHYTSGALFWKKNHSMPVVDEGCRFIQNVSSYLTLRSAKIIAGAQNGSQTSVDMEFVVEFSGFNRIIRWVDPSSLKGYLVDGFSKAFGDKFAIINVTRGGVVEEYGQKDLCFQTHRQTVFGPKIEGGRHFSGGQTACGMRTVDSWIFTIKCAAEIRLDDVNVAPTLDSLTADAIINAADADIQTRSWVYFASLMRPHLAAVLDNVKLTRVGLMSVEDHICDPKVVKGVFKFPTIAEPSDKNSVLTALMAAKENGELSELSMQEIDDCIRLVEEIIAVYANAAAEQSRFNWISESKLAGLTFVEDPDVAALAMWLLEDL